VSTIVVGVDGSESARAALRFALDEARMRGAAVRAVAAWHVPTAYGGAFTPPADDLLGELETATGRTLERALTDAGDHADVEVEPVLREGAPARVLLEEASDADLLVVGSRGLGGFRGLLLGSVSQQCTQHAPCPVVVVPHERELSATPPDRDP
jgi:nucleotide-binding universal stress UspA family protein